MKSASKELVIMTGKHFVSVIFSILILTFAAFGQTSSISGEINDQNGAPIAEATVVLRNQSTGLERIGTTDHEGRFSFSGLGSGPFSVIASSDGFARKEIAAETSDGGLSITLEPAGINAEVVVVSGSRQEELRESLNTKVDVLTEKDLRTTGYETVGEALREVPGVVTRRSSETAGTAGEQVQGIDSRQVLVLMDGQPLVGARGIKSGILNLDRQSTGRLESVEVVKGASSALYGSDAIGGVINLRTKEPSSPFDASANFAAGNFGVVDARGSIGFKREKLSGIFMLERHKNNGFDLDPDTFTAEGSGFHRYDTFGRLKYRFTENFALTGSANSYWNDVRGRVQGEPAAPGDSGLQTTHVKDDAQNYGLTADWSIDERTSLQLRGYFARFDEINRSDRYPSGIALPDGNLFQRYGKFDATFTRIIGERHFLQVGTEFATDRYSGINRLQNDKASADTQVFWIQDKISVIDRLTLTLGGRFDHHSSFGSAVSPKIGLNFRVNDNASLRASWGRGFRAPDLGQLYYRFSNTASFYNVLGNPDLSPEHSGSWQVGGEFNAFARRARFGVNFFRNDVRNLINSQNLGFVTMANLDAVFAQWGIDPSLKQFVTLNTLLFFYRNVASVYTQGVEADASFTLPSGFTLSGAYTYLDAVDKASRAYLTGRHKHHGFAKLVYDNPRHGFSANLRGTFFGSWLSSSTNRAPAFQLWDVYVSKSLWKGFQIYGTIDNLFDNQDPNSGTALPIARADAGRTFRIGIRWNPERGK